MYRLFEIRRPPPVELFKCREEMIEKRDREKKLHSIKTWHSMENKNESLCVIVTSKKSRREKLNSMAKFAFEATHSADRKGGLFRWFWNFNCVVFYYESALF
jgi:hypothetical protein